MKINLKRSATKFASGFAGGFGAGGWAGGFAGGTVAALTGGKAKPLKSMAIGAGAGFAGGYAAQLFGYQGRRTSLGKLGSFQPLSSRAFNYFNPDYLSTIKRRSSDAGTAYLNSISRRNSANPFGDFLNAAVPVLAGGGPVEQVYAQPNMSTDYVDTYYGGASEIGAGDFAGASEDASGSDWMPLLALGAVVFLVGGA